MRLCAAMRNVGVRPTVATACSNHTMSCASRHAFSTRLSSRAIGPKAHFDPRVDVPLLKQSLVGLMRNREPPIKTGTPRRVFQSDGWRQWCASVFGNRPPGQGEIIMKSKVSALMFVTTLLMFAGIASADEYDDTIAVFKGAGESGEFFKTSYGYAVFPTVGKGGLGVGAAHGRRARLREGQVRRRRHDESDQRRAAGRWPGVQPDHLLRTQGRLRQTSRRANSSSTPPSRPLRSRPQRPPAPERRARARARPPAAARRMRHRPGPTVKAWRCSPWPRAV